MDKIGNVSIRHLKQNPDHVYTDGPVEAEMLSLVTSDDFSEKRDKILANYPTWAMYYHFTPTRGNIINWKDFKPGSRILEIGAGCGAITEAILQSVDSSVKVDAIELSETRAMINAHRNKNYSNLEIIVGNIEDLDVSNYDYVICIGVLEYAGKFISGNDPYLNFLKKLRSFLIPNGELLLAIENKLGLKYINGAREDHVGKFYESLMDYPNYNGIRTFTRKELANLFLAAGFLKSEFYIPIPDYKIPTMVIHEEFITKAEDLSFLTRAAPAPAYDQPRIYSASEQLLTKSALDGGVYVDLSNSFLVMGVNSS